MAAVLLCVFDMGRKPLHRSDLLPYHVTARVNNREDFHLDLESMWALLGSECLSLRLIYGVEIHALVLMPNHFHLLLTVPEHDLGIAMNVFISQVTRFSNIKSGRSGHLFGGPYYWSLINSSRYFGHVLKYIYRNPVRAKLCDKAEDYPFSTLAGLIGRAHLPFPVFYTRIGMEIGHPVDQSQKLLDWLNRPFPGEAEKLIRKGLRRPYFEKFKSKKERRMLEQL